MNFLEERIVKDGIVKEGNILKVDSFLNHQMDVTLFQQMGKEFQRRFAEKPINKILTIEASGIGIACIVAVCFGVPVVFAKKSKSVNIDGDVYLAEVESFTHKCKNQVIVSKKFLHPEDHVLIIYDFLANGCALQGLISIIQQAGAAVYTPEGQAQTQEQIAYYMNNAKIIREGLAAAGFSASGGVNAPYIWLKTPDKMTSWEFFDYLLDKANVVGTPGSGFGPSGEGYFRLTSFGSYENTLEAVERIKKLK